jgi:hypothetical protein
MIDVNRKSRQARIQSNCNSRGVLLSGGKMQLETGTQPKALQMQTLYAVSFCGPSVLL